MIRQRIELRLFPAFPNTRSSRQHRPGYLLALLQPKVLCTRMLSRRCEKRDVQVHVRLRRDVQSLCVDAKEV